jgi:hypothetical protein
MKTRITDKENYPNASIENPQVWEQFLDWCTEYWNWS